MYKNNKISIVIPCYNEEKGIVCVLQKIPSFIDEIIVVDNGSNDDTAKIALQSGAKVVKEKRKGYGYAIKTGIKNISGNIVVTFDGDASYPVGEIKKLVDYLLNNNLDFISGCRLPLSDKKSMSLTNITGTKILNIFTLILFWKNFKDILSGMWVFKIGAYKKLTLTSNNWDLSEEIKIEAARKVKFGECHISHFARIGNTKLLKWRVGVENLIFLFWKRIFSQKSLPDYLKLE